MIVDGTCIWFEAQFDDETVLSTSPLGPLTSWGNRLYRLDREFAKGEQLRDRSKVKSWLFTTLHREFLGSRRRTTRFPHHEIESVESELPPVTPATVNAMDASAVMQALTKVDEVYRFYTVPASNTAVGHIILENRIKGAKKPAKKVVKKAEPREGNTRPGGGGGGFRGGNPRNRRF